MLIKNGSHKSGNVAREDARVEEMMQQLVDDGVPTTAPKRVHGIEKLLRFMRSDGARVSSKRAAQHRWDDWHHLWVDWHHRWDDWHHRWVDWHSHFVRCYF